MTLHELQRRLSVFNIREEVSDSIETTKQDIIQLNQTQLLRGLDSAGNYLSPRYSEDPFFKSPESALRYAKWKKKISPDTDRPFDVPNLYITGRYHRSMAITVGSDSFEIKTKDQNSGSIESKFGDVILGLNNESRSDYIETDFFPELKKRIEDKLGLKME